MWTGTSPCHALQLSAKFLNKFAKLRGEEFAEFDVVFDFSRLSVFGGGSNYIFKLFSTQCALFFTNSVDFKCDVALGTPSQMNPNPFCTTRQYFLL